MSTNTGKQDYRWVGPTTNCPRCGNNQFRTMVIIDQETHEIAAWGLDAECTQCDSLIKLACPADHLTHEPTHDERLGLEETPEGP